MVPGAGVARARHSAAPHRGVAVWLLRSCQMGPHGGRRVCSTCPHDDAAALHALRCDNGGAAQMVHLQHLCALRCHAGTDAAALCHWAAVRRSQESAVVT